MNMQKKYDHKYVVYLELIFFFFSIHFFSNFNKKRKDKICCIITLYINISKIFSYIIVIILCVSVHNINSTKYERYILIRLDFLNFVIANFLKNSKFSTNISKINIFLLWKLYYLYIIYIINYNINIINIILIFWYKHFDPNEIIN